MASAMREEVIGRLHDSVWVFPEYFDWGAIVEIGVHAHEPGLNALLGKRFVEELRDAARG